MPYKLDTSANILQKRAIENNIQVEQTRISLKRSQSPMVHGRAEGDAIETMDNMVVENLIHVDPNSIFKGQQAILQNICLSISRLFFAGLLLKSQPLQFIEQLKFENVTANKLSVVSERINFIKFDQLLKSSVEEVAELKTFRDLEASNIEIAQTLNNHPLKFLTDDSPLELSDGFEFLGDINVDNLVVKSINGFNVTSVLQNVFLRNERNTIHGNLIFHNVTNVKDLNIRKLMDIPVEALMTTATDQVILANVSISQFHVTNLMPGSINNEEFNSNVAVINAANDIEGKSFSIKFKFIFINFLFQYQLNSKCYTF